MNESMQLKRTHYCGELRREHAGSRVTLAGWVHRRRDHGGLIFLDLRDRTGLVQLVFHPDQGEAYNLADAVRSEYVVAVRGRVERRPEGRVNPHIATGEVEVFPDEMKVLNPSKTPPFYIVDDCDADEVVRLRHRYLDLRRPDMQKNIILRHRIVKTVRDFLDSQGFIEIETPMLVRSTPEGARDYLVPSRVNPGRFYALPQSPQLFKQLLMVAGFDRYFQIARCFRDEDLRADRQPEFTQIDIEMAFVDKEDIMSLVETLVVEMFDKALGVKIEAPFPKITYAEAMLRYGSDKPDLRFGLEIRDITDLVRDSAFKVFAAAAQAGGRVRGLCVPGAGSMSRSELDGLSQKAVSLGAKGLVWVALGPDGVRGPASKFLSEKEVAGITQALGASKGDLLLIVAGQERTCATVLGALRLELARSIGLLPRDRDLWKFCWVTEFPLFEYSEEEKRLIACHHPFTAPMDEDMDLLKSNPQALRAKAYDLVLNGTELSSGSIRIHRRDIQEVVFDILGIGPEEAQRRFGFLLEAFEYGAPPHGGIAFGLDRTVMLMSGRDTIRDVIAFPKTSSGSCLLTGAPSEVDEAQLKELGIRCATDGTMVICGGTHLGHLEMGRRA